MLPFMAPLPFTPVELVAIDPARNLSRYWRICASHDLFGEVVVQTSWGRIGRRGRTLVRSFAGEAQAARYVAGLMRIRRTAERRIGAAYVPSAQRARAGLAVVNL
jgi:predicted DNA-binding WGR domain protein